MTREEFLENVTTWWELRDACEEFRYSDFDGLYDEESFNDYLDEHFSDMLRHNGWRDVYDAMSNVPSEGYEYYMIDDYGDMRGLDDDDFEEWKRQILEKADDDDLWDEDEEEVDESAPGDVPFDAPFDYSAWEPEKCEPEESTEAVDFDGLLTLNAGILHGVVKTL